jgi:Zn-dependent protease with chaperone function
LNLEIPFAAQVGVWKPQLVVCRGLLEQLDEEHLRAVLAHEEAHRHYGDTLWMFAVGWLRHLSGWLPNTEVLWQELLTLRELRADRWAAQRVDPLVLGEALVQVVGYGMAQQPAAAWVRPGRLPPFPAGLGLAGAGSPASVGHPLSQLRLTPFPSLPWRAGGQQLYSRLNHGLDRAKNFFLRGSCLMAFFFLRWKILRSSVAQR